MLAPSLSLVDLAYLEAVCAQHWHESTTLDFKRELPGNSDKDKHELLKDVCALANADGGDLVFGIDEVDGAAASLAPISTELADAAKRRIAQTIDTGIEPRLLGMQTTHVDVPSGYVLVVRVPASYMGPHCIRVNNSRRFVMRNGTSTSDLTFDQLRSAFDRTASLAERARQFLVERTRLLQQQETPKPLITGPIRALHLIPLSGLAGRQAFDLQSIYSSSFTRLLEPDWGGGSRLFNLDGLVVYPGGSPEEGHYGYTQVFRIGAMEAASLAGGAYQADPSDPEKRYVWSLEMTKFFRERTGTLLALSKEHGFVGPAVLRYSVLHVTGYELGVESLFPRRHRAIPDRPHLVAPELWIESLESVSLDAVVRPLLDTLWQGFGLERCLDYDAQTGEYRPQRR